VPPGDHDQIVAGNPNAVSIVRVDLQHSLGEEATRSRHAAGEGNATVAVLHRTAWSAYGCPAASAAPVDESAIGGASAISRRSSTALLGGLSEVREAGDARRDLFVDLRRGGEVKASRAHGPGDAAEDLPVRERLTGRWDRPVQAEDSTLSVDDAPVDLGERGGRQRKVDGVMRFGPEDALRDDEGAGAIRAGGTSPRR